MIPVLLWNDWKGSLNKVCCNKLYPISNVYSSNCNLTLVRSCYCLPILRRVLRGTSLRCKSCCSNTASRLPSATLWPLSYKKSQLIIWKRNFFSGNLPVGTLKEDDFSNFPSAKLEQLLRELARARLDPK